MPTDNRNAVIHTTTGAVLRYGFTDFLNDYDPVTDTIVPLEWSATPVKDVTLCYQKVENDYFVEMSAMEKVAVDVAGLGPKHTSRRYPDAETNPETGVDGDRYFNTLFGMEMQYDGVLGKWLSTAVFSLHAERNGVTAAGAYYRGSDGRTMSATRGITAQYNGTVIAINYTRDTAIPATFEITASGNPIAELSSNAKSGFYNHLDGDFNQGDVLAIRNKAGGNPTQYASVDLEIRWRA